ncbi:MAG TPA: penicillin-binding protein 2 [Vicinamibacterales bacterium]|nr:penicillin-binding protein 2 [Vicinamibacterales bacterium]
MVLRVGAVVLFALLAVCFWFFQIIQHAKFQEMAENNHQRELPLRAPRGVLFDRDGRVLVENRPSFNVSIVRLHTTNLDRTIRLLAAVAGTDERRMQELVERHRHEPPYRPIVVIEDATLGQVAAIIARRLDFELPDVVVQRVPTRNYPIDGLAAHLFGYVGEASDTQVAANNTVKSGDIIGQAGLEKTHNDLLMGTSGLRTVVVNSTGREMKQLEQVKPVEGRRVKLTIDYDLQKAAEDGFKALGYQGAAVVLDPRNGEVLTFVSLPAYDPNRFAAGIDRATWAALNTDRLRPLQNRAIQGRYSPGSTFKIAVATAALEEGVATPDFRVHCSGGGVFYGRYFKCHLKGGHGTVDMRHALEKSCNVYFYTLGNMLGVDRMHKWATRLGLGVRTGIDLPNEVQGIMPSTAWKKARTGEKWYAGETISVAIGQGQVSVTPLSLAVMMATVANGGTRFVPHTVRATEERNGWTPVPAPPPAEQFSFKPSTVAALHDGLWMVVNAAGTGGRGRLEGRDVAGKTGTAQVISLQGGKAAKGRTDKDLRDHGWFVFFAPRDNPVLAGVIFAEHAEHGYLGAPIAKHIIATYYAKQEGQPLPVFPVPGQPAPTPAEEVPAVPLGAPVAQDASPSRLARAAGPAP